MSKFPGTMSGPWSRYVHDADARSLGTVRYPGLVAKDDDCAKKLQKPTLNNLHNERLPTGNRKNLNDELPVTKRVSHLFPDARDFASLKLGVAEFA
jgi:hypothetical protein